MPGKRYTPTALFRLGAVAFIVITTLLAREAVLRPDNLLSIFVVGLAIVTVFMILGAFAEAEFDGTTFVYRVPLRRTHRFELRQIEHLEIGGRRMRALIIGYHPLDANGLVDGARVIYVNLVPLNDQLDLYEQLGGASEHDG